MSVGEIRTRKHAWAWFLEEVLASNDGYGYHNFRVRIKTDLEGVCADWETYCDILLEADRISENQWEMWKKPKHYPRPLYSNVESRKRIGNPTGKAQGNPAFSANRKLTDIDVKAIKNLLIMDKWSLAKIAEEFGVGILMITRIKNGERYTRIRVPHDERMKWADRMRKK